MRRAVDPSAMLSCASKVFKGKYFRVEKEFITTK